MKGNTPMLKMDTIRIRTWRIKLAAMGSWSLVETQCEAKEFRGLDIVSTRGFKQEKQEVEQGFRR